MTNQNTPEKTTQTPQPTATCDPPFEVTRDIDASGLRCPLPLLKAKQALNQVAAGQCIRVLATDNGSVRDFHTFARLSGNTLIHFEDRDGLYEYILRRAL